MQAIATIIVLQQPLELRMPIRHNCDKSFHDGGVVSVQFLFKGICTCTEDPHWNTQAQARQRHAAAYQLSRLNLSRLHSQKLHSQKLICRIEDTLSRLHSQKHGHVLSGWNSVQFVLGIACHFLGVEDGILPISSHGSGWRIPKLCASSWKCSMSSTTIIQFCHIFPGWWGGACWIFHQ